MALIVRFTPTPRGRHGNVGHRLSNALFASRRQALDFISALALAQNKRIDCRAHAPSSSVNVGETAARRMIRRVR